MDVADEINQNIEINIRENAVAYMRPGIEAQVKDLNCKNCNSVSYVIRDFSNNLNAVVAHLKCDNCGFEEDFTGNYSLDIEESQKEIAKAIHDLQKTIEDANKKSKR